jgi:short-subunit dehydrogenase
MTAPQAGDQAVATTPETGRRVVVITGASDGIGAAAARALARRGDRLVLIGRSPDKTRRVAAQAGGDGRVADFADLGQVRDLAAELTRRYPQIDVLIITTSSSAGTARDAVVNVDDLDMANDYDGMRAYWPSPLANDTQPARRLWDQSSALCGL